MPFGFSKDSRIDMHLNNGLFNGRPIYIHYTSQSGYTAIMSQRYIAAKPDKDRRGNHAKAGVYLIAARDAMNRKMAHHTLFLGEDKYRDSATHCIVFAFNHPVLLEKNPVSSGSAVHEIIHRGNIPFHSVDVIYDGQNRFL